MENEIMESLKTSSDVNAYMAVRSKTLGNNNYLGSSEWRAAMALYNRLRKSEKKIASEQRKARAEQQKTELAAAGITDGARVYRLTLSMFGPGAISGTVSIRPGCAAWVKMDRSIMCGGRYINRMRMDRKWGLINA